MKFERLVFDANAAIDWLRPERPAPPHLDTAAEIIMPLFVYAELRLGFTRATRARQLVEDLEGFVRA